MTHQRIQVTTASLGLAAILAFAAAEAQAQSAADTFYWNTAWAEGRVVDALQPRVSGLAAVTRTLSIDINAPREAVYDVFANVYTAYGIHPFLREITAIRCNADTFDFIALEDIPVGAVTLLLKTVARQAFHRPDFYTTETYDRPLTLTHQSIRFTALSATSTRVEEELSFEALPLLINVAVTGGVDAHDAVQKGLKAAIESGAVTPVRYPAYMPIACSEARSEPAFAR